MKAMIRMHALFACCLAVLMVPGTSRAADHYNLEAELPTELTDTIPIDYRNTELQGFFRWQHTREGQEEFHLVPRLEYGLFPNAQLEIEAPYEFGEAVEDNEFKTVGVELLYNLNQEGLYLPAIAVAGRADFAVGDEVDGTDTTAKLILSKTIGKSAMWNRLHLNAAWTRVDKPAEDERDDLYAFVVGYDRRISADAILILDYVRRQERERGHDINLVEAGMRYQCTPLTVVAWGVGAGIGEDSPDFRATIGFQHSFNGWFFR
jgi:hypothetical protein